MSCTLGLTTAADEAHLQGLIAEYEANMARICLDNHLPAPRKDEQ